VLKRSFIALPFALAAITLPFTIPGETLLTVPVFGGIIITIEGTIRFASILIKSWISVQMAILMVAVTPFPDMLWGLRALYIPQPLISIISFMYRYLFVLSDEVLRLLRARASRSAAVPGKRSGGTILWRGKVAGRMAGSLMLRSFERSERIYNAMASRGYQGKFRSFARPSLNSTDYLFLMLGIMFFGSILVVSFT
jgi:cobalt/nickel transport system permease protein